MTDAPHPSPITGIEAKWFRQVLGQYPTGVCIVTAADPSGGNAGMAVGSFTSVSLDPPLVAFFPDKSSTTWPRIERAGRFCVNVLAADQEPVCRAFAAKGADKFERLRWRPASTGSPIIDGAIAWIDCSVEQVHEAGDHYIVVGRVRALDIANPSLPLLFFQGGYGRFVPESLVTGDVDLLRHFRHIDRVRPELEALANLAHVECNATVRVRDEVVIIATAGQPRGPNLPTRLGHRYAMVPPVGCLNMAWEPYEAVSAWLARAWPQLSDADNERTRAELAWIREHDYSWLVGRHTSGTAEAPRSITGAPRDLRRHVSGLRSVINLEELPLDDVDVWTSVSAPAFDASGRVSLAISLYGFEAAPSPDEATQYVEKLLEVATKVTGLIGGRHPTIKC